MSFSAMLSVSAMKNMEKVCISTEQNKISYCLQCRAYKNFSQDERKTHLHTHIMILTTWVVCVIAEMLPIRVLAEDRQAL